MYGYVVWLDVLLLNVLANFFFDFILLWATAAVARAETTRWRLAAGAGLGAGYFLIHELARIGLVPHYGLIRFLPVVIAISLAMLAVTFQPRTLRRLAVIAGHFYPITFVAAGAGFAAAYHFGGPGGPHVPAGYLAATATVLIIAEVGWGVVQRRLWQTLYQLPVELDFGTHTIRVNALVDTGNRLRDPISGSPVIILEGSAMEGLLPNGLRTVVATLESGDLTSIAQLSVSETWSSRFRVIPFASLGKENGLLIGFRPDQARIWAEGRNIPVQDVVVGLSERPLDPDGAYRALVHPDVVSTVLSGSGYTGSKAGPVRGEEGSQAVHATTDTQV